ncbi:MAG: 2-polyprenyl-3-methyl-5-hydroxy-6-metoxy-1,4-benzoquinol methylase [Gammaproteobacteria bacterium]|jgi:2-polyprenyl-3-methyl-5-hydroxy-6-metoxy-1,4-benzoquinol methylase|tara:strand:+ start:118 stop:1056 length:939 start_codon:yes stop_codon:yes gene_type:complete
MKTINHNIKLLYKFNLSDKDSLKIFNESTRDVTNLNVLKCIKSDVIVLERLVLPEDYYEKNIHYTDKFKGSTVTTKDVIESKPLEDDVRRFELHKELIKGSEILDFGCGRGGFIQLSKNISKRSVGLELNKINREYINNSGVQCVNTLSELNDDKFDLITLNHVFEHLNDPINILIELQKYLKDDGIIIIEVPHARDLLLETFNLESFKNFTLWSEHLILHTKKSLEIFATNSGLHMKSMRGFQRYPISNHYNWLLNGQPSGHEIFDTLNNDDFHSHYEKLLDSIDQTDTLIGYFEKNLNIKIPCPNKTTPL